MKRSVRRAVQTLLVSGFVLATALALAPNALAAGSPPAGGAAIGQVIAATLGATVATLALLWVISAHRSGRIAWLGRLAGLGERLTGLPGWASIPASVLGGSLLIAVFGMYWDISIHLDNGRDPGPLANPAHYFILVGLFGVLVCGALSIALAGRKPSEVAKELSPSWWAPLGATLILVCSAVSLIAFPLDDIWHRIFGQDVTLWGPTHLLLFGGASLSLLGLWVLQVEGARSRGGNPPTATLLQRFRDVAFAAEYGWSHVWNWIPWPQSMLSEAIPCAIAAGLAGGILGGYIGRALTPDTATERAPRWLAPAAGAVIVGLVVWCLPMPTPS